VVEVNGHKSNAVPLTAWKITIHADIQSTFSGTIVVDPATEIEKETDADLGGSFTTSGDMVIWVRADIHGFRPQPGATPQMPGAQAFSLANSITPTKNLKLTSWNGSGTKTEGYHHPGEPIGQQDTIALASKGSGPVLFDGSDPTRGKLEAVAATVDAKAHILQLYVGAYGANLYQATVTSVVNNMTTTTKQDAGGLLFHLENSANGPVSFQMTLGSDFGIQGGSQTETTSTKGVSTTSTFSWSGQVFNAPTDTTSRSALPVQKAATLRSR